MGSDSGSEASIIASPVDSTHSLDSDAGRPAEPGTASSESTTTSLSVKDEGLVDEPPTTPHGPTTDKRKQTEREKIVAIWGEEFVNFFKDPSFSFLQKLAHLARDFKDLDPNAAKDVLLGAKKSLQNNPRRGRSSTGDKWTKAVVDVARTTLERSKRTTVPASLL